jgi:restriction system protein
MGQRVDEEAIRKEIQGRGSKVPNIREDWLTPAGNERHAPMYEALVSNAFLNVEKVVKGRSRDEVVAKARKQLESWEKQEIRRRLGQAKEDLKTRAQEATDEARVTLEAIRNLLAATLSVDDRIDWDSLTETREFQPEPVKLPPDRPYPPEGSFWQKLLFPLWRKQLEEFAAAEQRYERQCERLQADHERQQTLAKVAFDKAKQEKNRSIAEFRAGFEAGEDQAIEEYMGMVFERSAYPEGFQPDHECHFDAASKTLVVDVSLPGPHELPNVVEYKPADRNTRLRAVEMKNKDVEELYDLAVKLVVLRTLHEVFEAVYVPNVEAAVVNGWTTTTDLATGHDETSCIISVEADRETFEGLKLDRVDPTTCIKSLKGLVAGPLSQVAPVRPLMRFDREDPRFVESKDVLADMNARTNLAEIPWEEFEHLVRELFSKMFSGEDAEVRVTQASRDAGVDAIAFDPDPIRGGKFVIQAKRYTNVVGVSAVRDLYGTMINEGAVKGILVTTSYYGRDSREFAKDKPITLIDGSNLVYLLEQHGYQVRIDLKAAKGQ